MGGLLLGRGQFLKFNDKEGLDEMDIFDPGTTDPGSSSTYRMRCRSTVSTSSSSSLPIEFRKSQTRPPRGFLVLCGRLPKLFLAPSQLATLTVLALAAPASWRLSTGAAYKHLHYTKSTPNSMRTKQILCM